MLRKSDSVNIHMHNEIENIFNENLLYIKKQESRFQNHMDEAYKHGDELCRITTPKYIEDCIENVF